MSDICPKTPKCPLFNGTLLKRSESADAYKNGYCNNSKRYQECKRFMVSEKFGKCADFVLPNSMLTMEEISKRMKEEGLLK